MKIICDWDNCSQIGSYKAPVEKNNSKKYRLLCLEHIKIFNKKWNYFSDMNDQEIEYFIKSDITWHKPTKSFASSENILNNLNDVYWILGGIPKKNDKFKLPSIKCKNIKAFIFGSYRNKFHKILRNKLKIKKYKTLSEALCAIFLEIKDQEIKKNIIFFSPAGASFDSFKNFEDRGNYFNKIIKKYINAK